MAGRFGPLVGIGKPGFANRVTDCIRVVAADVDDRRHRYDAVRQRAFHQARVDARADAFGDQEPAAARVHVAHDCESGGGVLRTFDDDVLKQIRETCIDRAFAARVHLDVLGAAV